jgi:hypothetical protein
MRQIVGSNNRGADRLNATELQHWGSWEHCYRMDECVDRYAAEGELLQHSDWLQQVVNGCTAGSNNITTDQNNVAELQQVGQLVTLL